MTSKLPQPAASPRRGIAAWLARATAMALVVTLAACSSGVKLDEVPVEDRNAGAAQTGGTPTGVDPRAVAGVVVPGSDIPQPTAMARVLYFDYDSFEVRAEYTAMLEANARYLKANTSRRVALEGHTDERGGREYNLALGQKRAEAVRRALSLLGVSEAQLEAVSFGEEKPAAVGFDETAFAKNRRVEITYR